MDALNSIVVPLRPYILPLTRNLPAPLHDALVSLLGPTCHQSLLQNLDLSTSNAECVKLGFSKALGIGIVSTSAIVKVPQLIKLLTSQSASGLSFLSYLLETAALTITLAYNVRRGFPFSTYGESAFIAVQDIAIAALILVYSRRGSVAAVFGAGLAAVLYALFSGEGLVDMQMLGYLQAGAGVLGVASKVPQIWTVWSEGSTGQLSAFAVFNYFFGSLSRIFTTMQEVGDPLILSSYVASFVLNAVLALQMLFYWNSPSKKRIHSQGTANIREKVGIESISSGSESAMKARGPSTRRRG